MAEEQLFHTKGAEFLAKITGIVKEKKSSRYFQAKNRNLINGIDEKLLKILRSAPDICSDPISETFIHLDEETANYFTKIA